MASLTAAQAAAFRLRRQHLLPRAPAARLDDVVGELCGVQAQVMGAAELALHARLDGLTGETLEHELWRSRRLTKTWCMRGTLHLLPSQELPIYFGSFAGEAAADAHLWLSRHGVSREDIERMTAAVVDALQAGSLTRKELADRVAARLGEATRPWIEHSWGGVLKQAARRGLICFGPPRGRDVTFVRLEEWLPGLPSLSEDEARQELLVRYLRAYGPATPRDISLWSGLRMPLVKAAREGLGHLLVEVPLDGRPALLLRDDLEALAGEADSESVRLLPSFDPYLLAHADKGMLVAQDHYKRVYRKAGWISPVLLVNGRAAGVWSHRRRSKTLALTIEPFERLSSGVRGLIEAEAARLATYFGLDRELSFTA